MDVPVMWGWGHSLWGFLAMAGFWALLVWVVVSLARGSERRAPDARDVLADRFARGEISEDEYRDRLAVLKGRP